jgi:uncharacterized protein (TIGR02466 family)
MEVLPLFSTPVYIDFCDLEAGIIISAENTQFVNPCGDDPTYGKNGSISTNTMWLETVPDLKRIVEAHLAEYVFGVLGASRESVYLEHQSSWVNLHHEGDRAASHVHVNSMFSGVVYLNVPENSGDIIFSLPSMIPTYATNTVNLDIVDPNLYNMREFPIAPEQGMIIIFPSHIPHYVTASRTHLHRYSVAFNYFVKGDFGSQESRLTL